MTWRRGWGRPTPTPGGDTDPGALYTTITSAQKSTPASLTMTSPGVDTYVVGVILARGTGGFDFSDPPTGPFTVQHSGTDLIPPVTDSLFTSATAEPVIYYPTTPVLVPASSSVVVDWATVGGTTRINVVVLYDTVPAIEGT